MKNFIPVSLFFISTAFLVSFFSHCGSITVSDLDPDDFVANGATSCSGVDAAFQAVIQVFESEGCTNLQCHGSGSSGGSLNLDTDDGVGGEGEAGIHTEATSNDRVNTTSPADSPILEYPLGLNDHEGGALFDSTSDADYVTIFCWIEADTPL